MKLTTTKLGSHFYSVFGVVFIVASVVGSTDSIADSDSAPKPNEANQDVKPYVEILSDAHAWKRLPKLLTGEEQPLPNWAKAVATQLPRTAAAMLELDAVHRMQSPLDPALRAKLRWMIAHANRCQYSEAYAIADLRRSGAMEAEVEQLVGDRAHWRDEDRDVLNFVQIMTTSAPSLPDSLFSSVKDRFGDRGVAAMILLAAYGNFQDRIILGLNLPLGAIGCNYCMGHCEMLLEVAGLEPSAVSKRTRMLAETDWAAFPIAEQRAYAFARKLTRSPWELTAVDYHSLETEFGKQKAMSIFWWLCRGLYMTRVSDGFQLPLERENVFE